MRSPAAERALRRLVARLAAAPAEDRALVIAALDPAQRDEIERLLAAYDRPEFAVGPASDPEPPPPVVAPETPSDPPLPGVSPWIAERLTASRAGEAAVHGMTAAALRALKEAAAALPPPLELTPGFEPGSRRTGGPLRWLRGRR